MQLMRNNLIPLFKQIKSANAGLLMQKGLREWDTNSEKPIKKALIKTIGDVKANNLYLMAFNRWLNCTFENDEFVHLSATVNGRLFTGLALGGAIETGAMVHHTYGMPMIAGSSIKGAVRAYAEYIFAKRKTVDGEEVIDYRIEVKNGEKIKHLQFDVENQQILDVLFGVESDDDNADAGYLIWHDAWWIPNVDSKFQLRQDDSNKPFVGEIVTVHHQQYYQGNLHEALDIENPIPNQQIAMTGSFYFTIQGASAWVKYALELLKGALQYQGLGAKGSNGYGYFEISDSSLKPHKEKLEGEKQAERDKLDKVKADKEKEGLSDNQKFIYDFKAELDKKPTSEWHNKPNATLNITLNGEHLWFATLLNKVETWDKADQKYALEQVFSSNKKHLSKKLQDKVKELVKTLG